MKKILNFSLNNSIKKEIIEWIFCILIALILALLFRYFIATPTTVKMTSMFPTLEDKDKLLLNRTIRISNKIPQRGDIITFERPSKTKFSSTDEINTASPIAIYENEPAGLFNRFIYYVLEIGKESYIKRVIALPGEHVKIKDGNVYINDKKLDEPYLNDGIVTDVSGIGFDDFVVPENCIFAMGDNRAGSIDCRNFGCIPFNKIEGIVLLGFFHLINLVKYNNNIKTDSKRISLLL